MHGSWVPVYSGGAIVNRNDPPRRNRCADEVCCLLHNALRTHRSLNKDAPFHRAIQRLGAITSQPVLGRLHHQYCRIWFSAHAGMILFLWLLGRADGSDMRRLHMLSPASSIP